MSLRANTLEGFKVEMFDANTNEKIDELDSLSKAARVCGCYNRSTTFNTKIYKQEIFDVVYKGKNRKVYFKLKN